jgi:hypothetical protein
MLDDISRAIADKAGSDERTLTVSIAAVGFSVVVASVFIWALWKPLRCSHLLQLCHPRVLHIAARQLPAMYSAVAATRLSMLELKSA